MSRSAGASAGDAQDDGRPRIQHIPFDGTDYPTWKFRMEALFCAMGMMDVVEGKSALAGTQLTKARESAFGMIVLSLKQEIIHLAYGVERGDCVALWKKLSEQFERNTRSNKITLRRQLYEVITTGGSDLDETIGRIEVICSRLSFLGVVISDEEKLAVLLSAAGDRFETVTTLLELRGEVTYAEAIQQLKDFQGRDSHWNYEPGKAAKVKGPYRKGVKCYNCGKEGHIASECMKSGGQKQEADGQANEVKSVESFAW
jgi:gag-polypeptide of LTR copia-type/Zinc knuckle